MHNPDGDAPQKEGNVRRDNMGRWLPGSIPNPGGRPNRMSVLAELNRQLDQAGPDGRPQRVRLVEMLISAALDGDMRAALLILQRVAPEQLALKQLEPQKLVQIRAFVAARDQAEAQELAASEIPSSTQEGVGSDNGDSVPCNAVVDSENEPVVVETTARNAGYTDR